MLVLDLIINAVIIVATVLSIASYYRESNGRTPKENLQYAFIFYTTLSNFFSMLTSIWVLIEEAGSLSSGVLTLSMPLVLIRYIFVVSVMVTFLTVLVYLAPAYGFKSQYAREEMHMHLVGPLLAFISFCFIEKTTVLPAWRLLLGGSSVIVYGAVYLHNVLKTKKWDDFYLFTKINWHVSLGVMVSAGYLLGLAVYLLHNTGI